MEMAEMAETAEMADGRNVLRKHWPHCPVPPTCSHVSTEAPSNGQHCK